LYTFFIYYTLTLTFCFLILSSHEAWARAFTVTLEDIVREMIITKSKADYDYIEIEEMEMSLPL